VIYTKHIAGEYDRGLQRCVICGAVIIDDRGAMSPEGSPPSRGWDEGEVYMSDGNPRITMKADPSPEYKVKNCQ
jgi:hypothetical protein